MINYSDKGNVLKMIELETISLESTLDIQKNINKQLLTFMKNYIGNIEIDLDFSPKNKTLYFINKSSACLTKSNTNIKNYIYSTAENLCSKPDLDEIHIENKIVFAVAIRLKAEDYMISKLKQVMSDRDFYNFYSSINSNQTSALTKKFEKLCSPTDDIQLLIKEVNLITPENIHLNSFMFEPLIDMSVWRLKKLYQDTQTQLV